MKDYDAEQTERTFNKDIAFLMEIQRLEQISNNFAIEGKHTERLRTLTCWKGALSGILTEEENQLTNKLINDCKEFRFKDKTYYNTDKLNKLHEYLNMMNTKHKLQLTTRATGAEAARI